MTTTLTDTEMRQRTFDAIHEFVAEANTKLLPGEAARRGYQSDDYLEVDTGRKYIRIAIYLGGKQRSVHCFVGCAPGIWGDVYKAAGWKAPMLNGARYNLLDADSRDEMYRRFDFAGGYLYK
jgi:anaerobic selenocysteine-containing dehydrogenase